MKKLITIILLAFATTANAQLDTTALLQMVNDSFPSNVTGAITSNRLRAVTDNIIRSSFNVTDTNAVPYLTTFAGNTGLGTSTPDTTLHVVGKIKYEDGNEGDGKVLTSDASGNASWQAPSGGGGDSTWVSITVDTINTTGSGFFVDYGDDYFQLSNQRNFAGFGIPAAGATYEISNKIWYAGLMDFSMMEGDTVATIGVRRLDSDAQAIVEAADSLVVIEAIGKSQGISTEFFPAGVTIDSRDIGTVALFNSDGTVGFPNILGTGTGLTIDGSGYITRTTIGGGGSSALWTTDGNGTIYYDSTAVGIGTQIPNHELDVDGVTRATSIRTDAIDSYDGTSYISYSDGSTQISMREQTIFSTGIAEFFDGIKIEDLGSFKYESNASDGYVLTSDAYGNATWQKSQNSTLYTTVTEATTTTTDWETLASYTVPANTLSYNGNSLEIHLAHVGTAGTDSLKILFGSDEVFLDNNSGQNNDNIISTIVRKSAGNQLFFTEQDFATGTEDETAAVTIYFQCKSATPGNQTLKYMKVTRVE